MRLICLKKNCLSLLFLLTLFMTKTAQAENYYVIINLKNMYDYTLKKEDIMNEVTRLYLRQQHTWPSKGKPRVVPFDLSHDDGAYSAFVDRVLRMTPAQLEAHWQSIKQRSGISQPRVTKSDRRMIRLVAKQEGALGYIHASSRDQLPKDVKILFAF